MLIESDRLTDADRYHWYQMLELDELHSRTGMYKTHVKLTMEIIVKFIEKNLNYYVAVSWGKDSVVLAHMFHFASAKCKYYYLHNIFRETEGCLAVRNEFLSRYPIEYEEIVYNYAEADETYFDLKGRPAKWYNIRKGLHKKHDIHVTGVRSDESAERRMRFKYFGLETEKTFAPFMHMEARDIFAYLLVNDLPTHPNYAMTGGGRWDKYRIRVSALGHERGAGIGRTNWETEYYPDRMSRIKKAEYDDIHFRSEKTGNAGEDE